MKKFSMTFVILLSCVLFSAAIVGGSQKVLANASSEISILSPDYTKWNSVNWKNDWFTGSDRFVVGAPKGKTVGGMIAPAFNLGQNKFHSFYQNAANSNSLDISSVTTPALSFWVYLSGYEGLTKFGVPITMSDNTTHWNDVEKASFVTGENNKKVLPTGWNKIEILIPTGTSVNLIQWEVVFSGPSTPKMYLYDIKIVSAVQDQAAIALKETIVDTEWEKTPFLDSSLSQINMSWSPATTELILPVGKTGKAAQFQKFDNAKTFPFIAHKDADGTANEFLSIDSTNIPADKRAIGFWLYVSNPAMIQHNQKPSDIWGNAHLAIKSRGNNNNDSISLNIFQDNTKFSVGWNYVVAKMGSTNVDYQKSHYSGLDYNDLRIVEVYLSNNGANAYPEETAYIYDINFFGTDMAEDFTVTSDNLAITSLSLDSTAITENNKVFSKSVESSTESAILDFNVNNATAKSSVELLGNIGSYNKGTKTITLGAVNTTTKLKVKVFQFDVMREYMVEIFRKSSAKCYLTGMTIDGTALPGFSQSEQNCSYKVAHDIASITIGYQKEDESSTVQYKIDSGSYTAFTSGATFNLNASGDVDTQTIIKILVTAQDNRTTFEYTLTVVKKNRPSDINTLSSLKVDNVAVDEFAENKFTYVKEVDYTTNQVTIAAIPTNAKATVEYYLGDVKQLNGTIALNNSISGVAATAITIKVISEAATEQIYTVTINRLAVPESISIMPINKNEFSDATGNWYANVLGYYKGAPQGKTQGTVVRMKQNANENKYHSFYQITDDVNKVTANYYGASTCISLWINSSNFASINKIALHFGSSLGNTSIVSEIASTALLEGWNNIIFKVPEEEASKFVKIGNFNMEVFFKDSATKNTCWLYDIKVISTAQTETYVIKETIASSNIDKSITSNDFSVTADGALSQNLNALSIVVLSIRITNIFSWDDQDCVWTISKDGVEVAVLNGMTVDFKPTDGIGTYIINLKAGNLDAYNIAEQITVTYRNIEAGDLLLTAPTSVNSTLGINLAMIFKIELSDGINPDTAATIKWYVNDVVTEITGTEFTFTKDIVGDYKVYAKIDENIKSIDYYVNVHKINPSIVAQNHELTLLENQTEINLSELFTVSGGDYVDTEYTIVLKLGDTIIENKKLTVSNETKAYVITIDIQSKNSAFLDVSKNFTLTVNKFVTEDKKEPAKTTSCGSIMTGNNGGSALMLIGLIPILVIIAKKRKMESSAR